MAEDLGFGGGVGDGSGATAVSGGDAIFSTHSIRIMFQRTNAYDTMQLA